MPLNEAISHLLDSSALCDVTFAVGAAPKEQKCFKGHKLIFAARSDVFLAMFYGALPEKERVEIIDMEPGTFDILRRYIYTDKMTLGSTDEAIDVYFAANKYNLEELTKMCDKYFEENLSPSNVCQVYELAFYMEKESLKCECDKIIRSNIREVLEGAGFVKASAAVVRKIFEDDNYAERNELFFFQSALRWAEEECRRQSLKVKPARMRQALNPILPHIRFLSMTHEEFVKGPALSKLLSNDEMLSISMNIGVPGCVDLPLWCSTKGGKLPKRDDALAIRGIIAALRK